MIAAPVARVLVLLSNDGPTRNHSPELTAAERHADALQRFDNRDRYIAQSEATVTGVAAELPPRAPLQLFEDVA